MLHMDDDRFRLAIPLHDAVAFAIGSSDLGYPEPDDALRKIVGLLAIDALEYTEQWSAASLLRANLENRWAELKAEG